MAKLTISFEVPRKDGKRKVVFNLSHRGGRKRIPVDIELLPNELTKDRNGNLKVKSDVKAYEIERELQRYTERLHLLHRENAGIDLTVDDVYSFLMAKDKPDEIEFFAFAERWLNRSDIKGKKNYVTMLNSLENHIGMRFLPFLIFLYFF